MCLTKKNLHFVYIQEQIGMTNFKTYTLLAIPRLMYYKGLVCPDITVVSGERM
jgi:hypothetical protein